MDQSMPVPPGSGSLTVTPVAVATPLALLTVIVNPICEPADTEAASAVLLNETFGHVTVVDAVASDGLVPFVSDAFAVLSYFLHDAAVVGLVMCALVLVPTARSPLK